MRQPLGFALATIAAAFAAVVIGCSSNLERSAQGSLAVSLSASGPGGLVRAARVTISELEARRSDGTWASIESGFPKLLDVLALANGGGRVTLPANLQPEGHYNALKVRISEVELTPPDGATRTTARRDAGWAVLIPVDFRVANGRETNVELVVRLDLSLKLVDGQLEFEPEIEVSGVRHD